jgi:hypothetical protein
VSRGEDSFLALASVVADEMYGKPIPVVSVAPGDFARLRTGQWITIEETGRLEVLQPQ